MDGDTHLKGVITTMEPVQSTAYVFINEIKEIFSNVNNEINLIVSLGIFISLYISFKIVINRAHLFLNKRKTVRIKNLAQYFDLTKTFFVFFLSLYIATHFIRLTPNIMNLIAKLTGISTILQFAIWINYFVSHWIEESVKKKAKTNPSIKSALSLFRLFGKVLVWGIFGLMLLNAAGFNISTLLAGLGIGGIAIGLAAQKILSDLFASVSIILDNPFAVGDKISFGEFTGRVEYIGLKTTHIRSKTGELIVCSNADLIATRIKNLQRVTDLKVEVQLTIASDTDFATLKRIPAILKELIVASQNCNFKDCYFSHYAHGSLVFSLSYIIGHHNLADEARIKEEVNYKILEAFQKNNIRLDYPTQRLVLEGGSKAISSV
jgi:MscS family membrane protein